MALSAWNCRGLGTPLAIQSLKDVVQTSKSRILGLVETKCGVRRCEALRVKLGFHNCFCVPAKGRSSGLALFWRNDMEVNICNYSHFHIDFLVRVNTVFCVNLFYGSPRVALCQRSWDLIRKLHDLSNSPWCIMGVFKEVLSCADLSKPVTWRLNLMAQF
ncbi:hypothetical protein QQ045_020801 [Rhodiola kirilowii]